MTSDKAVPPGGEGTIKVTFNPKGRPGAAHKTITIQTNDPERPHVPLKLVANVVGSVIVDPPNLNLGDLDFGKGGSGEIAVSLREDVKGTVEEARTGSTKLKVERLAAPDAKGRTVFRIAVDPSAPIGTLRDVVTVVTDVADAAPVRVAVSAEIVGDVVVEPRHLSLSQPEGKLVLSRRPGKPPVAVREVSSSTPDATATLVEVKAGELYEVKIAIAEGKPRVRGKITVKLADPKQPEIVVPLAYATPGRPVGKGVPAGVRRNLERPRGQVLPAPGDKPAVK